MTEAEIAKNVAIVEYFKRKCHLKEETLWGKMKAAQDDVNDRVTKLWNLPEPSSESDTESSSSDDDSSDSEENDTTAESEVRETPLKGQLLRRLHQQKMKTENELKSAVEDPKLLAGVEILALSHEDEKTIEETKGAEQAGEGALGFPESDSRVEKCTGKAQTLQRDQVEREPISFMLPPESQHKQTLFSNTFVHGEKEFTVTTRVIKGGADFILADEVRVKDASVDLKAVSTSDKEKMWNLMHTQCSRGDLDAVSSLIETNGVSPSIVGEVINFIIT